MLLDHFSGALEQHRDWHGFHQTWAIMLAADLNQRLPEGWFAEPNVQFQLEIDVAAIESKSNEWESAVERGGPSGSGAASAWAPPAPTAVLEIPAWNDVVAVEVYAPDRPRSLAGAIELISPSNKDRPASRESFVAKCERYLQTEMGLIVVDIVTARTADLHHALLERLDAEYAAADEPGLYACSYHPRLSGERLQLKLWRVPLTLGGTLPTLPLYLREGPLVAVDLEKSYLESCRALRIPQPAS